MPYESEANSIKLTFTGDAMISRALKPFREERFLALRDVFQRSDVSITNGEMLFHNYEDWPTYLSQTYMRCDPRHIEDLQWMGLDMMSCANNHGTDYGEGGVLTNLRHLDAAGMVHAGTGANFAEALEPAYFDSPMGRVALVSATSSARANSRAGEQRRDMKGRPGVNLIRWVNEWTVDREAFDALRRVAQGFGWRPRLAQWWYRAYGTGLETAENTLFMLDRNTLGVGSEDPGSLFVLGDGFERHSRIHQGDLAWNLKAVAEARKMADWVVFSMHNHEGGPSEDEPSDHIVQLAHAVIDAGADVFMGHGPHLDRGVEVYKGKPILYSLGNFIIQNDTVLRMPQESMVLNGLGHEAMAGDLFDARRPSERRRPEPLDPHHQSAVATVTFTAGALAEVRLHPLEFGDGLSRGQFGRPILSTGSEAQVTLERFQRLSKPFGTVIDVQGDDGVIRG